MLFLLNSDKKDRESLVNASLVRDFRGFQGAITGCLYHQPVSDLVSASLNIHVKIDMFVRGREN